MNQVIRDWRWMHWLLLALVLAVVCVELLERHSHRLAMVSERNLQQLDTRIVASRTLAETLLLSEQLPATQLQWQYVEAIASFYGVGLRHDGTRPDQYYQGPLDAWHGTFQGSVGSVLVAAQRLQETVPAYLYDFSLANGSMTLAFSVLGSNEHEN